MKNITIAGRLGKDAELRRTQNGDPVLGFTVAVDDGYGQAKRTLWFKCSLWGKRGESLAQHLTKGTPVTVSGDLSTEEYQDKTQLTVRVNDVTMQGGARSEAPARQDQSSYERDAPRTHAAADLDDDLPF